MNLRRSPADRRVGAAAAFVDSRQARGLFGFPLSDLAAATGLRTGAALAQLRRLRPKVARVSPVQPFFLIVPPEFSAAGGPPVDRWLDDYFSWLGRPYYLALQSAAGAHGSNPQSVQVTQVMTDRPRRPIRVGRLRIVFFVKRSLARTPTQELPRAFAPLRVSTPAATSFDLVRYAPRIGGIGRALETLRPLLPLIRPSELRAVLAAEEEISTAQRLGYLLARSGRPKLADAVDAWLPSRRPVIPLSVGAPAGLPAAPLETRWRVADNSGEFAP
jgi:AbiEi antitoxin C-terminal domain